MNHKTTFRRIKQQLTRYDAELTETIQSLINEAKHGNDDTFLVFLNNPSYPEDDGMERNDVLYGINLKTEQIVYNNENFQEAVYKLTHLGQHRRLDLLEQLANGAYTTYKETEAQ